MRFGARSWFRRSRRGRLSRHPILIGELPSTAQHSIQLDDHRALVDLCLSQRAFGREQKLLSLQYFEIAGPAGEIALHGDVDRDFERLHSFGLLGANLLKLLAGGERIRHFLKSSQSRLLVPELRFFPDCHRLTFLSL